jgi:hypothetical protein
MKHGPSTHSMCGWGVGGGWHQGGGATCGVPDCGSQTQILLNITSSRNAREYVCVCVVMVVRVCWGGGVQNGAGRVGSPVAHV